MIRTPDRKVPQVMIEARIVEADTTFVRSSFSGALIREVLPTRE